MALLRAQLAGWNGAEPELDDTWRSVAEYLQRFEGTTAVKSATSSPTPRCGCSPSARTTAPPRRPSSTPCARSSVRARRGAVGLSAGLTYAPGMYASDDELVALCGE